MPARMAGMLTEIACPLCGEGQSSLWAQENGFRAVRCSACGLVYVNPRPALSEINEAVRTGVHGAEANFLNVVADRAPSRVRRYSRIIGSLFRDRFETGQPISWLDVGAGYGEVVEAVERAAPRNSKIEGIEPMRPKVEAARKLGFAVSDTYLSEVGARYDVVSLINVFSHIPDFGEFLGQIKRVLNPGGELLIETGNGADVGSRRNYPWELSLPDHLVFAGEKHIVRFLSEGGFELRQVRRMHVGDGPWSFGKNVVKFFLGRDVTVYLPYTGPFRTIFYRARLV